MTSKPASKSASKATSNTTARTAAADSDVVAQASRALDAAAGLIQQVEDKVTSLCVRNGSLDMAALDRHQIEGHGFAWMASYLEILIATRDWAKDLDDAGKLGRLPTLLLQIGFGEYLAQVGHGIAMSQDEIVQPDRYGLAEGARTFLDDADVGALCAISISARPELIALLRQADRPPSSMRATQTTRPRP